MPVSHHPWAVAPALVFSRLTAGMFDPGVPLPPKIACKLLETNVICKTAGFDNELQEAKNKPLTKI